MKTFRLTCFVLALAVVLSFSSRSRADLVVGTASGGVITDAFGGAQEGTQVVSGGPSQNFLDADDGATQSNAKTQFGPGPFEPGNVNRASAYSVGSGFENPGSSSYAASYWGDELLFTGGLGNLHVGIGFFIEGTFSDETGTHTFSSSPDNLVSEQSDPTVGTAKLRWRNYLFDALDLNSIDFAQGSPDGGSDMLGFSFPDGMGIVRPSGPNGLSVWTIGISFDWQYGVPLEVGMLLEAWAENGAYADVFSTSGVHSITVPQGTTVQSSSNAPYNIIFAPTQIPEPGTLTLIGIGAVGLIGYVWRRRKPAVK